MTEFHWTLTGGLVTAIDGVDLLWTGQGSTTLYLATPSQLIRVEPDRFQHDGTKRGAKDAMLAFISEGAEVAA